MAHRSCTCAEAIKIRIEIVEDVICDLINEHATETILDMARDYLQLLRNIQLSDVCTHGHSLDISLMTPIPELPNDDYNTTDDEAPIIDLT